MPQVSEEYLEKRKRNIARLAQPVFAKKGYYDVSMKDIMEEVNISRGGLYAHFKNIDDVFISTLQYDDSKNAKQLLTIDTEKIIFPQLANWINNLFFSVQKENTMLVKAKSEFFLSHDINEFPYLKERYEALKQSIQHCISLGIETGEFKNQRDINSLSELLISMIDGVMLNQYYQYSSNNDITSIVGLMIVMLKKTLLEKENL